MADLRVDKSKVVDYLLNSAKSRGKADFFSSMGFRADRWEALSELLKRQATEGRVVSVTESPYGTRFCVDGEMSTPDGRLPKPRIRTVWIEEGDAGKWRLITAHPV